MVSYYYYNLLVGDEQRMIPRSDQTTHTQWHPAAVIRPHTPTAYSQLNWAYFVGLQTRHWTA